MKKGTVLSAAMKKLSDKIADLFLLIIKPFAKIPVIKRFQSGNNIINYI